MIVWILKRLFQALLVVLAMTIIVFVAVNVIGDPIAILVPPEAGARERERLIAALNLDRPLIEQYFIFLSNALHGDLGSSFVFNEPAFNLILKRMPATLELAFAALVLSIGIGLPVGLYCGLFPDRVTSRAIS